MAATRQLSGDELKAFFKACKKNGVETSKEPRDTNLRLPIVVNHKGYRFEITEDMQIVPVPSINDCSGERKRAAAIKVANVKCRQKHTYTQKDITKYNKRKGAELI